MDRAFSKHVKELTGSAAHKLAKIRISESCGTKYNTARAPCSYRLGRLCFTRETSSEGAQHTDRPVA